MNIFKILASGKKKFNEEYMSAFLAYILSPAMDHGLGSVFLSRLIGGIADQQKNRELGDLGESFDVPFRSDLFASEPAGVAIQLEQSYPDGGSSGFIDIVVKAGNWYIIIENKIYSSSVERGQLEKQYKGFRSILDKQNIGDYKILSLYIVPAPPTENSWSADDFLQEELQFDRKSSDAACIVYWHPVEGAVSVVGILRDIIKKASIGDIQPLNYDTNQLLLSLIDFVMGEFSGFTYNKLDKKNDTHQMLGDDILKGKSPQFIGVQHGMGGLIRGAWKNRNYIKKAFNVSDEKLSWQYLPREDFKKLYQWAVTPESASLEGIKWSGKPFFTDILYLVAKTPSSNICIGMKGGLEALKTMSREDLGKRRSWEISDTIKSNQWFRGEDFVKALEEKGYRIDAPKDL